MRFSSVFTPLLRPHCFVTTKHTSAVSNYKWLIIRNAVLLSSSAVWLPVARARAETTCSPEDKSCTVGQKRNIFFDFPDMGNQPPVIVPAKTKHTATVIFLHGLGDSGHGWSPVFETDMCRLPHVKYILPHAASRPVSLNMGMRMPAWFDMFGLSINDREDEKGIEEAAKQVRAMMDAEIESGIPSDRIVLGGFSMGGALAIYTTFSYPKKLAGLLALSSFILQRNKLPFPDTPNKHIAMLQTHGDADPLCDLSLGQATHQLITVFDPNAEFKIYKGLGHSANDEEIKDMKAFLEKVLPPQ